MMSGSILILSSMLTTDRLINIIKFVLMDQEMSWEIGIMAQAQSKWSKQKSIQHF